MVTSRVSPPSFVPPGRARTARATSSLTYRPNAWRRTVGRLEGPPAAQQAVGARLLIADLLVQRQRLIAIARRVEVARRARQVSAPLPAARRGCEIARLLVDVGRVGPCLELLVQPRSPREVAGEHEHPRGVVAGGNRHLQDGGEELLGDVLPAVLVHAGGQVQVTLH